MWIVIITRQMNSCSESLNKPDGHLAFNSFPLRACLKCRNFIGILQKFYRNQSNFTREKRSNKEIFSRSKQKQALKMHNCISTIGRTRRAWRAPCHCLRWSMEGRAHTCCRAVTHHLQCLALGVPWFPKKREEIGPLRYQTTGTTGPLSTLQPAIQLSDLFSYSFRQLGHQIRSMNEALDSSTESTWTREIFKHMPRHWLCRGLSFSCQKSWPIFYRKNSVLAHGKFLFRLYELAESHRLVLFKMSLENAFSRVFFVCLFVFSNQDHRVY